MKSRSLFLIFFLLMLSFFSTAQLTGEWTSDDGVIYRIRQIDNRIFWSMDNLPRVRNVFVGYIAGNAITGVWADLPGGNMQGSGTLALRVESPNRMVKTDQTGDYQGTVWTRGNSQTASIPSTSDRPDLSGIWYDYSAVSGYSGAISKITQQGDKLVFINSFNDQSDGYFIDNTTVIGTKWQGGLKANLEDGGRRIAWKNGSVWERSLRTQPQSSRPDLSGTWYDYSAVSGYSGAISKITQQGDKLVFINSFNDQSDGYFIDNTTVIGTKWQGGLKATLEDGGRRIAWKNGSVWERNLRTQPQSSRPDLSGIWYDYSAVSGYAGVVSKITQQGDKLVFINSFNDQSDGYFIDNTTVIATKWQGGLKASLEDGGSRIVWTNGSVWQRSKK